MTCSNRWTSAAALFSAFLLASPLFTTAVWGDEKAQRIVSIGGSVTEIIHELGEADRLIARDSTSLHPQSITELPDVGYIRRLSPEGVLSVDPDLIVTLDGAGPPEAVTVLKSCCQQDRGRRASVGYRRQGSSNGGFGSLGIR